MFAPFLISNHPPPLRVRSHKMNFLNNPSIMPATPNTIVAAPTVFVPQIHAPRSAFAYSMVGYLQYASKPCSSCAGSK